eukprot:355096-Chlamydomonas_euryale.AAC.13
MGVGGCGSRRGCCSAGGVQVSVAVGVDAAAGVVFTGVEAAWTVDDTDGMKSVNSLNWVSGV